MKDATLFPILKRPISSLLLCFAFGALLPEPCILLGQDTKTNTLLRIHDPEGRPLPCRIHLIGPGQKPHKPAGYPSWKGHFVCPGEARLNLDPGSYQYLVERGPEHSRLQGSFEKKKEDELILPPLTLSRHTNLPAEGWFGGDLHVHRDVSDLPLLMEAEDLHIAPVITWWRNNSRWSLRPLPDDPLVTLESKNGSRRLFRMLGGEDERAGGALLFFNLREPLDITGSTREYPSPMKFLNQAGSLEGAWVDIEKPFWWDVPVWLASGKCHSIGIANNHMCHATMYESEAWGKARDSRRLPPPRGNGFWSQELYYEILNSGVRIPPSAGSASGVLPNPLGYNRVYARLENGEDFTWDRWWEALGEGRSFVTNGPILLVTANGHHPGHVFRDKEKQEISLELDISITTLDPVSQIEIIRNGKVIKRLPLNPNTGRRLTRKTKIMFDSSGWFLVRAITDLPSTFRFASTAPFYVESGGSPRRISRTSTGFFIDWIEQRIEQIQENLKDPEQSREVIAYQEEARNWWKKQREQANAD